jgi:integrase
MEQTPRYPAIAPNMSAPLTLQGTLNRIAADEDLPKRRRQDLASSIRIFAKLLALPLATSPADPHAYRGRLQTFQPIANNVKEKRWQNIRSDVQFAINRYIPKATRRGDIPVPLDAAWTSLRRELTAGFGIRASTLSRFMTYCSSHMIKPDDVSTETFLRFREWMESTQLLKHPERTMRWSAKLWNRAVDRVPAWPREQINLEPVRDLYGCPWEALTEDLREDTELWLKRLSGANLLDESAPSRPAAKATLSSYKYTIRQLVGALERRNVDITQLSSLADLVRPETLVKAIEFLKDRTGKDRSSMLHHIASKAIAIARHHAKLPENQIRQLQNLQRKVQPREVGLTAKNKERLAQFLSEDNQRRLLCLPPQTFERLGQVDHVSQRNALDAQCALAVEILLFAPIRRLNLVALNLERHVRTQNDGRQRRIYLSIPGHEVKNAVDLDFELPPESSTLFLGYLERFRPRLLTGKDAGWLFPGGREGQHKAPEQFARNVTAFVRRETGLDVNLHLFRHITAHLYLDEHPGGYEVVRRTHGHKKIETTTNSYTGLETARATKHFDDAILARRHLLTGPQAGEHKDD